MSARPTLAALLRAIAEEESLERTLARFPGLTRAQLVARLNEVADRAAEARSQAEAALGVPAARASPGPAPASPPPPSSPAPARSTTPGTHRRLRVASDGAARGNPGPAGAGAVLFDASGAVVERLGRFLGRQTNNVAEYQGLLLGVRRALELGAEELEVMADSELMIRQLSGRYQVKSPALKQLHGEALAMLKQFSKVKLVHVPRAQNAEADEMSNRAIDERM